LDDGRGNGDFLLERVVVGSLPAMPALGPYETTQSEREVSMTDHGSKKKNGTGCVLGSRTSCLLEPHPIFKIQS